MNRRESERSYQLSVVSYRSALVAVRWVVSAVVLGVALWTWGNFLRHYALNVSYVYAQPLQMARWLDANTPPDATVAVHDVGMMRYMGNRTTIDMVGLTTPGAADAWRNGPGAVAEFLIDARPDYVAAYTDARGLSYLADTGIYNYRRALVEFPVTVDMASNVALAAESSLVVQGIYQPDWGAILSHRRDGIQSGFLRLVRYSGLAFNMINVGDISSELLSNYWWRNSMPYSGFPTEVYEQDYIGCQIESCLVIDGGRLINGEEEFDVRFPGSVGYATGIVLVTRLHPMFDGTFDVFANDQYIATRWIPKVPGHWLEIATFIPPEALTSDPLRIRIVPSVDNGLYMPYSHWVYHPIIPEFLSTVPLVTYQSGAIALMENSLQVENSQLDVNLTWQTPGNAHGDYIVFVHVYNDIYQAPIAQSDSRPGGGTLPPGNWLPGVLRDTMTVDLTGVPPGRYQVAVGMYDAVTLQNLHPDSGGDELGRVFIGEIEIPDN